VGNVSVKYARCIRGSYVQNVLKLGTSTSARIEREHDSIKDSAPLALKKTFAARQGSAKREAGSPR